MSSPIPPEILDHVVDQLHNDPTTLKTYCLVSKSWIHRARKHLFASVSFDPLTRTIGLWKETFPDPINSPAHHARTLSILHARLAGNSDTILTFCNVERLNVITGGSRDDQISLVPLRGSFPILRSLYLSFISLPDSDIFGLICSFPLLEDLTLDSVGPGHAGGRWKAPPTSPRLSGTLRVETEFEGVRTITRRLLDLPNGIHFTKIRVPWLSEEDVRFTMKLVSMCADNLHSINITVNITTSRSASGTTGIDLSKAVKLRDVGFRCVGLRVKWITETLHTVKSQNLHRLSLVLPRCILIGDPIWELVHREWLDLDRLLVQFCASHGLRPRVMYEPVKGKKDARNYMAKFLPELTRRGIVDLRQLRVTHPLTAAR